MSYDSVARVDGKLLFSNLVVDNDSFSSSSEKALVTLNWNQFPRKLKVHVEVEGPRICVKKSPGKRDWDEKGRFLETTASVKEAHLEIPGLEPARVSYEKGASNHVVEVQWGSSSLHLKAAQEKEELVVHASGKELEASLLKKIINFCGLSMLGEVKSGTVEGQGHFSLKNGKITTGSAHVALKQFGIEKEGFFCKLNSQLDWDGDFGRIKASFDHVQLAANFGSVENLEGTLSYTAEIGGKWEIHGEGSSQGKKFPLNIGGRCFFQSQAANWLDATIRFGSDAECVIQGEEKKGEWGWSAEWKQMQPEWGNFLRGLAQLRWDDRWQEWKWQSGVVSGKGFFAADSWRVSHFVGEALLLENGSSELSCKAVEGFFSHAQGAIRCQDARAVVAGVHFTHWNGEASWGNEPSSQLSGWIEDVQTNIRVSFLEETLRTEVDCSGAINGSLHLASWWENGQLRLRAERGEIEGIPFKSEGLFEGNQTDWAFRGKTLFDHGSLHIPLLRKIDDQLAFDVRIEKSTWDLCRISGTYEKGNFCFDSRSHLLNEKLLLAVTGKEFEVGCTLPWKSIIRLGPLLSDFGLPSLNEIPIDGKVAIGFKGTEFSLRGSDLTWEGVQVPDSVLQGCIEREGAALSIHKGKAVWGKKFEASFLGTVRAKLCDLTLSHVHMDVGLLRQQVDGFLDGSGHITWDGEVESDFIFNASDLKIGALLVENKGPIHFYFSSTKGAFFRGLDLQIYRPDLPELDCQIESLHFDASRSHWVLTHSHFQLPAKFFPEKLHIDPTQTVEFIADLDFASDFSNFTCFVNKGSVPFFGINRALHNLFFSWEKGKWEASFQFPFQESQADIFLSSVVEPGKSSGKLIVRDDPAQATPLTVEWEYATGSGFVVQSAEGIFGGVDASFHAEAMHNHLIGSARLDFSRIIQFIPTDIAQVFQELKMGNGFEIKGRLDLNEKIFRGIFCGKQVELFGYQFRTLLSQVDLTPKRVHISDLKVSDTAGSLNIGELLIGESPEGPWTLSIPQVSILEFRPSLLQKVGGEPGTISPLVIRELKITDCKGILDDPKSYTAKGELAFINSYKREPTVFDLPADVLSRIVGLDLDLLIPVRGEVSFALKDGLFTLNELRSAYSENTRSEFFLEKGKQGELPSMDLDGNLKIFVRMKQFVLFKFTESFIISIDGKLNDPHVSLKKRSFFGL